MICMLNAAQSGTHLQYCPSCGCNNTVKILLIGSNYIRPKYSRFTLIVLNGCYPITVLPNGVFFIVKVLSVSTC